MIVASVPAPVFRWVILGLLAVNEALLILGVILYPIVLQADGLLGLGAATAILGVYGLLALRSPIALSKAEPRLVRGGMILGLISGAILSLDLVSGYLISHNDATNAGTYLLAYGGFLLLRLGAGGWGAARTGQIRAGVTVALWCVLTALLIWFCVEFAAYYLFAQTASGAAFIRMEMAADFTRSGARDYAAFVMADFYGAGFFHLLLGLILGLLLGTVGALAGLLVTRSAGRASGAHVTPDR
jgi:hypothetical protein